MIGRPDLMPPVVPFVRPCYPPSHAKGPVADGVDMVAVKRAISRAGFWPWQDFDDTYSERFATTASPASSTQAEIDATGNYGQKTHDALVATHRKGSRDGVGVRRRRDPADGGRRRRPAAPVAARRSGAVCDGGVPVLDQDCTHATSGLDRYPGVRRLLRRGPDGASHRNRWSSPGVGTSRPGQSIYADGVSGIRCWFGHLVSAPSRAVGTRFAKGQPVRPTTCANDVGGGPHAHVGVQC